MRKLFKLSVIGLVIGLYCCPAVLGQCKGFHFKKDAYKGGYEMHTLWIENSVKLKSPKVKYRLNFENDKSYLLFNFYCSQETVVKKGEELILLNKEGETIKLIVEEDVEGIESNFGTVKVFSYKLKLEISLEQLEKWNNVYKSARVYFNDSHMTFPFDHIRNYELFHKAKQCYTSKLKGF